MLKPLPLCALFFIVMHSLLVGHPLPPSQAEKYAFLICNCQNRELTFAGEVSRKNPVHIIFIYVRTGKLTDAVTSHSHVHFSQSATNSSALLF